MRRFLCTIGLISLLGSAHAQISITAADMPVPGDSLRYSNINVFSALAMAADSGDNMTWNYDLSPVSQGMDTYKRPSQVSPFLALSLGNANCYGYKVADSIPGLGFLVSGLTISDLYTFYNKENVPPCFAAEAFSASIAGFPVGASYSEPDVLFMFPLTYGREDSNSFELKLGAASFGSIQLKGYRKSKVDGWGTIKTPFFTSPKPCIRVRSEIVEVDSVMLDSMAFGIPRTTVEYRWLVNGEHYPALFISTLSVAGFEVPLTARFRDKYRPELNTRVRNITIDKQDVFAYPNPASEGWVRFELPDGWTDDFYIEMFDVQGKSVMSALNKRQFDVSMLPKGDYLVRIMSGGSTAYVKLLR